MGPTGGARFARAAGVLVVCGGVAVALTAFGPGLPGWPTAQADQRFVDAVRAEGRTVAPGPTETLVISAAHKLCDRRDSGTSLQRREGSLSADEIDAVRRTFGDDEQTFLKVVLRTYCS